MFAAAGVVIEEPLPDFVQRLWRGCALNRSRGMAWTWNPERAKWFASRSRLFGFDAGVSEIPYDERLVLAVLGVEGRSEQEVVVNPNRLRGRFTPILLDTDE